MPTPKPDRCVTSILEDECSSGFGELASTRWGRERGRRKGEGGDDSNRASGTVPANY